MTARAKSGLLEWLKLHGGMIDRDAAVSVVKGKQGHIVTFSWTYDRKRAVRISFSGVSAEERNIAMIAWLNGEFLPKAAE